MAKIVKKLKIRSMTGIGTARGSVGSDDYLVEVRSVNNRYLDLSVRAPNTWTDLESSIRSVARDYLKRGKVVVSINLISSHKCKDELRINKKKLALYHDQLSKLAKKMKVEPLKLSDLLKMPQVFETSHSEASSEKVWRNLSKILKDAFTALVESREKEGENLKRDFVVRLGNLKKLLRQIKTERNIQIKEVHKKLLERLKKFSQTVCDDADRLAKEAAYLSERADISEEVVRFESHLELFQKTLNSGKEAGKKLDFILQEINREANTIGSKANRFNIAKAVIEIKSELEKIREQVQNIE